MRTPLILMTTFFAISFFDGFFGWGLSDGFYLFAGLTYMFSLAWMWKVELAKK